MIRFFSLTFLCFIVISCSSQTTNVIDYPLPDSIKVVSFLAEISVTGTTSKKEALGIKTDVVRLSLEFDKKGRKIVFAFPKGSAIMANGIGIKAEKNELSWKYDWKENEN